MGKQSLDLRWEIRTYSALGVVFATAEPFPVASEFAFFARGQHPQGNPNRVAVGLVFELAQKLD